MRDTWNMTPDEARKYILQNWFDGDENVNSFVCGDEEYTAMAIAVEALEATKWHYPSKGEYPKEKELVLMKIPGCFVLGWYDDGNWFKDGDKPLSLQCFISRWQYIIPPEYDKHRATASKAFKVTEKEVTEEQRRLAKTMNFGIVYGECSK